MLHSSFLALWLLKRTEQLKSLRDSWSNDVDNQPHGAVKFLEGALVEHIHRALVALTVNKNYPCNMRRKMCLFNLLNQAFVGNHVTFSQDSRFRQTFGQRHVREGVMVVSLKQLSTMLSDLSHVTGKDSTPPTLILVLSRVAIDFRQHLAQSLVTIFNYKSFYWQQYFVLFRFN